jgi:hypothetical protein
MTKSSAQLDAEIAEALRERKNNFDTLITKIEKTVDEHPELTRARPAKHGVEEAKLTYHSGGWVAEVRLRSKIAKGRGARQMIPAHGYGDTPEEAVDALIESLPLWAETLK